MYKVYVKTFQNSNAFVPKYSYAIPKRSLSSLEHSEAIAAVVLFRFQERIKSSQKKIKTPALLTRVVFILI